MLQLTVIIALADATTASDTKSDLITNQNEPTNGLIRLFIINNSVQWGLKPGHEFHILKKLMQLGVSGRQWEDINTWWQCWSRIVLPRRIFASSLTDLAFYWEPALPPGTESSRLVPTHNQQNQIFKYMKCKSGFESRLGRIVVDYYV